MSRFKQINVILTIFVTFLFFNVAFAADGDLDTSFNFTGKQITQMGDASDFAQASAIQPDGKIIVAGTSECCSRNPQSVDGGSVAMVRYNVDSTLDDSFGENGKVVTMINKPVYADYTVSTLKIQPDGKIIVGTTSLFWYSHLFRYNPDGSLDYTFNHSGKIRLPITITGNSFSIQADGMITVFGKSYHDRRGGGLQSDIALVRYHNDGSLDSSFGTDGIVTTQVSLYNVEAISGAIQPDGKLLVVTNYGYPDLNQTENPFVAILRYNSDGNLDITFGQNGISAIISRGYSKSISIGVDGKIFVLSKEGIYRFNKDGSPDLTFDNDGFAAITDWSSSRRAVAMTVQSDGKIVVTGGGSFGGMILRLNPDGTFDSSFGQNGVINVSVPDANWFNSVNLQSDGKIVVTVYVAYQNYRRDFLVYRMNSDGTPDNSWGGDGAIRTGEFLGSSQVRGIAVQRDGKTIAIGMSCSDCDDRGNGHNYFGVVRYNRDGTLDKSFDSDGKVTTRFNFSSSSSRPNAIAIQSDDRIIVVGEIQDYGAVLVRYNPNGSLDTSFDGDGIVTSNALSRLIARSVVIQSDGKIVIAASKDDLSGFVIVRFNPNGSLDLTFGDGGKAETVIGNNSAAYSLAIQADGKLVAAGFATNNGKSDFAVVRYNSNGILDTSFDQDGIALTAVGFVRDEAKAVVVQPDGKIVVRGFTLTKGKINESSEKDYSYDIGIARYNSDGSLDKSLNGDGKVITRIENPFPSDYFDRGFFDNQSSLAIQPDGKIVVSASELSYPIIGANAVAGAVVLRYNPDGSLDNSFGSTGKVSINIGNYFIGNSVAIQPDGNIVLGGSVSSSFGVVRLLGTPTAGSKPKIDQLIKSTDTELVSKDY